MAKKLFRILLILVMVIGLLPGTGVRANAEAADAETMYTIYFRANGKTVTRNVTLPHTFKCFHAWANEELDYIIKGLYDVPDGYCNPYDAPTSSNEELITCGLIKGTGSQYFTINSFFTDIVTVKGEYRIPGGYNVQYTVPYELEISCAVAVSDVTLDKTSAALMVGDTETLTAAVSPDAADKTVTWTSSDDGVATVADGVVTGVAPGQATITVTATNGTDDSSDDKTATCTVTVAEKESAKTVTLVQPSAGGSIGLVPPEKTQYLDTNRVTISVQPETGWSLVSLVYDAGAGAGAVAITERDGNGNYYFTMPETTASEVKVSAEFVETGMEYNLWVAGNQVTAWNKDNILGDGTASYDPLTKMLTLNGATITDTSNKRSGIYSMLDSLTITGSGENQVTGSVNGIFASGNLTIDGSVKAVGDDNGIYAENEIVIGNNADVQVAGNGNRSDEDGHGDGIYSNSASVTVNGGTVTATGSNFGIMGENAVINGGTVNAHGSRQDGIYAPYVQINGGDIHSISDEAFGIGAISDISINYATVTAETNKTDGYAIACIDYSTGTITLGSAAYIHDPYPGAVIDETARDGVSAYIALSEEDDTPAAKVVIKPVGVEACPLWVNGKQVTAYNAADILGDGTASYNAADNTLTLTNAVIKQSGSQKAAVYSELESLTIVGNGSNTIDGSSNAKDGIYSTGSLTLSGTLKALGKDYGVYTGGNLTISDGSSTVSEGNKAGVYALGDITINGGNTKVNGGFFYGIYAGGNISVNGGRTSATSSGLASNAIVSDTGTITIKAPLVIKKPENGEVVSTDTFDYIGNSDDSYTKEALIEPDEDHVHTFAFSAEGDTITATCTSVSCPDKKEDGTPYSEHITIYEPDHEVYGDGKNAAAKTSEPITGVDKPDIVYRKGTETLNAAPVDAGSYTASITVEGATAFVNYEITKKPVTVVSGITAQNKSYDGTTDAALNTADAVIEGVLKGDDLSVTAEGAFEDANAGVNKPVTITRIVLEGEDKDNYVLAAEGHQTTTEATISKVKITGVTLTNYIVKLNSTDTVDVATVIADKLTVPASAYDKTIPAYTEEGNYVVTVTAKDDSNFYGVVTVPFHVVTEGTKTFESKINETTFTYTGSEITPAVTVTDIDGKALTPDVDYKVYYYDNVEVGYGKVTVTGLGEYQSKSGPQIHVFEITKTASTVTTPPAAKELTYNGSAQELVTAGTAEGGTMMYALGTDASVAPAESAFTTSIPKETDAGTYYVWYKAAGDDNHNDSAPESVPVTINKAEINEVTLTNYVIKLNSGQTVSVKTVTAGDVTVPADTGYTADIPVYTEEGSYTVTVTAKADSNFSGSKTATFHVVEPGAKILVSEIYETEYTYNGTAFEPTLSVTDIDNKPLVKGTDYKVEYSDNTNAGYGKVLVYGLGDYTSTSGPQVHVFKINKADIKPSVTISGWNYGETPETPSVTGNKGDGAVTYSYKAKGDSTYSETAPTDAGTYTVKAEIAETDNYKGGTAAKDFTIAKAPAPKLTDDQKPTARTGLKYTGTAQRLVNAPKSAPEGYTVKYSLDGRTWSSSIPTGTESGPYTVKVRYIGDSNHEDFDGEDLKTAITIDYYVYAGNNQTWMKGSNGNLEIIFKSDIKDSETFEKWTETVVIDGKTVSPASYNAREGSLIVDLKAAYLDTLAVGRHDISVEFSDGSAAAVFNITEKKSSGGGSSPTKPSAPADNVVTCQMAGYPAHYSWNEAAKACQPGYIDVTGNFRPYRSSGSMVPNTRDGGLAGYAVTFTISIITAFFCGLLLSGEKHHD